MRNPAFVINPRAGKGEINKIWPRLELLARQRFGPIQVYPTQNPGDGAGATQRALAHGAEALVCVGGDGTLNEVLNGLFQHCESPGDIPLGFIPNGTGCDLIKTVPIPRDVTEALDLLQTGQPWRIDVGRIRRQDRAGNMSSHYFHNVLSFGVGGEVVRRVNRTSKPLGPFFSFLWSTAVSLLLSSPKKILLRPDSGPEQELTALNIVVANGQYHGGGMWIAPGARVDDGFFQLTLIRYLRLHQVLRHLPKLYNGRIHEVPGVSQSRVRTLRASSPQDVLLDVDGEQSGRLPVNIDILHRALTLIIP